MDDQVTVRLLLSAGAAVIGLAFLAYGAWARHGGSPGARRWMGNEFGNEPFNERMTVLGGPLFGLICLCFALGVLPVIGRYLMLVTFPLGALLLLVMLWTLVVFLPLPDLVYPRWARPLREESRRREKAMRQWLRQKR